MSYSNSSSLLAKLLTWFVIGLLAIIAFRLAVWGVKAAWTLGAFLLVTVVPILIVGWLAVKLVRFIKRDPLM